MRKGFSQQPRHTNGKKKQDKDKVEIQSLETSFSKHYKKKSRGQG